MPKRTIDTQLWCHPDYQKLPPESKLLYIYLWSNCHCTASGLYRISLSTIAFETGLSSEVVSRSLADLESLDITRNPKSETVWVKKFLKHQAHSPQFLQAVAKALDGVSDKTLVRGYLEYNHTLSIPYQYPPHTLPMSESVSESESDIGQRQKKGGVTTEFIESLKGTYPGIDIESEWQRCQLWWSEGKAKMKRPRSALLNWLDKAKKIEAKGAGNGQTERHSIPGNRPAGAFDDLESGAPSVCEV